MVENRRKMLISAPDEMQQCGTAGSLPFVLKVKNSSWLEINIHYKNWLQGAQNRLSNFTCFQDKVILLSLTFKV